jgi:hypothetical protein
LKNTVPNSSQLRSAPWSWYLIAVVLLLPVLLPRSTGQFAWIDALNAVALGVFLVGGRPRGSRIRLPFLIPVAIISFGSLLAVTNARSVGQSLWTLVQDGYLYLWFILLVAVLAETGRLFAVRKLWIYTAVVVAVLGLAIVLLGGHGSLAGLVGPLGPRAAATFPNPNYLADYLVLSLFIVLSAASEMRGRVLWLASIALVVGLVATKSNGGAIALLSGLVVWGVLRAFALRVRPIAIAGACALILAVGVLGWGLVSEWRVGATLLSDLRQKSFAERVGSSSENRIRIWSQLRESYARSPLGIGPGNSRVRTVSVEQRARPGTSKAKEAHSDYLGYAIERGPIALVGLLMLLGAAFGRAFVSLRNAVRGTGKTAADGAFAAAMIGGLVASSVHSLVIEKLHFRHFWVFLAVLYVGTECTRAVAARSARGDTGGDPFPEDEALVPIHRDRRPHPAGRTVSGAAAATGSRGVR